VRALARTVGREHPRVASALQKRRS
jgi:hypothetical protein